jgi:hypothetical protein
VLLACALKAPKLCIGVYPVMQLPVIPCSRRGVECSRPCPARPSRAFAEVRVGGPTARGHLGSGHSRAKFQMWGGGNCSRRAEGLTARASATQPLASLGAPLTSPRFSAAYTRSALPSQDSANHIADAASSSSRSPRHEGVCARFIAMCAIASTTPRPLRGLGSRPEVRPEPALPLTAP